MPIYMRGIVDHALDNIRTHDVAPPATPANPFLTEGGAPHPSFGTGPVNALIGLLFSPNLPTEDTQDLLGISPHDPLTG